MDLLRGPVEECATATRIMDHPEFSPEELCLNRSPSDPPWPDRLDSLRLGLLAVSMLAVAACANSNRVASVASPTLEWSDEPAILARIRAPEFPARDFEVTKFG